MTLASANRVLQRLGELAEDELLESQSSRGEAMARVAAPRLVALMERLRDDDALRFDMLLDLTAVDYLERQPRFDVVYHLYSTAHHHRLRIKLGVDERGCEVDSLVDCWPAANWMEREVFDLYGIRFRSHPDLRRLLLGEDFEGHPLRKDYPKQGPRPRLSGGR